MPLPEINMWQYRDPRDSSILPWFTDTFLRHMLTWDLWKAKFIAEWGTGHSTLWWAKNTDAWVRSMDHNPAWRDDVAGAWHEFRRTQDAEEHDGTKDPCFYLEDTHEKYVRGLLRTGNAEITEFDIIIIDGEWREACAREALAHVKLGGIVILDNSDWSAFAGIHRMFAHCESHTFPQTGHPSWTTTYWVVRSRDNEAYKLTAEEAAKQQENARFVGVASEYLS